MELKRYANEDEAVGELMANLVSFDVYSKEDAAEKAKEIVGTIPPSERANYDANDLIAAAQHYPIWAADKLPGTDAGTTTSVTTTQTTTVGATVTETALPEVPEAMEKFIKKQAEDKSSLEKRMSVSKSSKITKILFKNPRLIDIIPEGTKGNIFISDDQFNKIEKQLDREDTKNVDTWELVKKLKEGGKEVDLELSKSYGRVEGIRALIPSKAKKNENEPRIFNRESLIGFLFSEALLKIASDKTTNLGVQVKSLKNQAKKGKTDPGKTNIKTSVGLSFKGVSAATDESSKNANLFDTINQVKKAVEGGEVETKMRKVSTVYTVNIIVKKPNANNEIEEKKSKVRIKANIACPVYIRKEEYAKDFKVVENDTISAEFSPEELSDAVKYQEDFLKGLCLGSLGAASSYGSEVDNLYKQIVEENNKAAVNANAGF